MEAKTIDLVGQKLLFLSSLEEEKTAGIKGALRVDTFEWVPKGNQKEQIYKKNVVWPSKMFLFLLKLRMILQVGFDFKKSVSYEFVFLFVILRKIFESQHWVVYEECAVLHEYFEEKKQ